MVGRLSWGSAALDANQHADRLALSAVFNYCRKLKAHPENKVIAGLQRRKPIGASLNSSFAGTNIA
jgi:hypothetical protein